MANPPTTTSLEIHTRDLEDGWDAFAAECAKSPEIQALIDNKNARIILQQAFVKGVVAQLKASLTRQLEIG